MPTYLDLLPNELYRKIYEIVHKESIENATKIGRRRQLPQPLRAAGERVQRVGWLKQCPGGMMWSIY